MTSRRVARLAAAGIVCVVVTAWLGACGGDDGGGAADRADLSDEARRGADIADDNGCSACHRAGTVGPSWDGVFGSTVELDDGTTVVADEEYLTRAITDPGAEIVDGFNVTMPDNDLSDDEVAAVVAYIRELGGGPSTTGGAT